MIPERLLAFLKRHGLAVQATVFPDGRPQAAVVGFVVTDHFEFVFDTALDSRKLRNLRRDPRVALVVGWDEEQTVQVEGIADEPVAGDLERVQEVYFDRFPEGRDRAIDGDVTWVRVVPVWVRYSDFRGNEPLIVEYVMGDLGASSG